MPAASWKARQAIKLVSQEAQPSLKRPVQALNYAETRRNHCFVKSAHPTWEEAIA
jgi:hypothetical protein